MTTDKRKLTDLELDQRVRDRLLASGAITAEEIAAYQAGLQDVESQSEIVPYDQPAVGASRGGGMVEHLADDDDDDDGEGLE
jgi:hypothetical protein